MKRTKPPIVKTSSLVKKSLQEKFKSNYDKLKNWHPSKQANMKKFCSFPKSLFTDGYFLSLSALAIYPVLCCEDDYKNDNWKQLSLENIKKKTGLSIPTVQKAIRELCNTIYDGQLVQRIKYTEGQRTYWLYKTWFIRQDQIKQYKRTQFFFYSFLIETGIWRKLKPRAKALYLLMRCTSEFDYLEYCTIEEIAYQESSSFSDIVYRDRKWEVCRIPLERLCEMVKMSSSHLSPILTQLMEYKLIEQIDDGWIVFQ